MSITKVTTRCTAQQVVEFSLQARDLEQWPDDKEPKAGVVYIGDRGELSFQQGLINRLGQRSMGNLDEAVSRWADEVPGRFAKSPDLVWAVFGRAPLLRWLGFSTDSCWGFWWMETDGVVIMAHRQENVGDFLVTCWLPPGRTNCPYMDMIRTFGVSWTP